MVHELKILPEYFVAVRDGIKKFEVRKDDRPFEVGDILCLHEINCGVLTGRTIKAEVTYVLRHPDYCKEGYCILSIKVAEQQTVEQLAEWLTKLKELEAKHWDECRQIAHYDDELKEAKRLLKAATGIIKDVDCNEDYLCDECEYRAKCDGGFSFYWRYTDEALKLIGGDRC